MCWENFNAHSWGSLLTPHTPCVPWHQMQPRTSLALQLCQQLCSCPEQSLAMSWLIVKAVPKHWHTVIAQHSWVMVLFGGDWVMSTDPVLPHTWAHPSRSLSGAPCSGGRWDQWCGHRSCQLASGTESWDEHLWVNRHNSYMWDLTTWRLFSSIYAKSLFLG